MPGRGGTSAARLACFTALAFAITWSVCGLLFLLGATLESKWGALTVPHPLFVLAVWGPAIAALSTVAIFDGRAALGAYLRRAVRWRDGSYWYAVVGLGWPAALVLCRVLSGLPALPESLSSGAPSVIANALA